MKTVLVYATGAHGCQEAAQIEEAIKYAIDGCNVVYVHCGSCLLGCFDNPLFSRTQCHICVRLQRSRIKKYLSGYNNIQSYCIDEFIDDNIQKEVDSYDYSYSNTEDLKDKIFHAIPVGYGAMSTYTSLTRNIEAIHRADQKAYLQTILRSEILLTLALEKILSKYKFDLIVLHNGRYAQFKPVLGLAIREQIHYITTEFLIYNGGLVLKNHYENATPHSVQANTLKYYDVWNAASKGDKEAIARSFFENRRYGKFAGDTIYTKRQEYGKLPDDYNPNVRNIVLFNSSEDEFSAIDPEVDRFSFFPSQLEGIKTILDKYKEDSTIHFYLRIHPNLKDVPYSYHTDLKELDYPNLTVIDGYSPISSYSLLDIAEKVIVFGSTMGIESVYWGKPVICLAYALYEYLDVIYRPVSKENLWEMIDNPELPLKDQTKTLPYGYYYMTEGQDAFKYIDCNFKYYKVFGHSLQVSKYLTIFGSNWLYMLYSLFLKKASKNIPFYGKFKQIPR